MKILLSALPLLWGNLLFAQMPSINPIQNVTSNKEFGKNPNIDRGGIAIGNNFVLNGHANIFFQATDQDSASAGTWMEPIMDMMSKESGFEAYGDLDSHFTHGATSLHLHTNISSAFVTEQLFLKHRFNNSFSVEVGKFVSHRTIRGEEVNERYIRSNTYHLQQGFLGTSFGTAVQLELYDLITDLVNTNDQAALDSLVSITGISGDLDSTNIGDPGFDFDEFMTAVSNATVSMFQSMMLLRDDYKTSYNNGIKGNLSFSSFEFSVALTESIWNQMPDMADGDFGIDLQASAYLNEALALRLGFAHESVESIGSIMALVVPNSSDDINQFNAGIEFKTGGFTAMFEYDYMMLNPLDTDVWDIALLGHLQVNDLFGLGLLYSHEDLETPMGNGDSDKFSISLNFNVNDNLVVGVDYTIVDAKIAELEADLDQLTINSLYSF